MLVEKELCEKVACRPRGEADGVEGAREAQRECVRGRDSAARTAVVRQRAVHERGRGRARVGARHAQRDVARVELLRDLGARALDVRDERLQERARVAGCGRIRRHNRVVQHAGDHALLCVQRRPPRHIAQQRRRHAHAPHRTVVGQNCFNHLSCSCCKEKRKEKKRPLSQNKKKKRKNER